MTHDELDQCARLFRHLVGRSPKGDEVARIAGEVESLAQFRIHLLLATDLVPGREAVIEQWRARTRHAEARADANELMHAIELLHERHRQLDAQLLRTEDEMLTKLRAIDVLATTQAQLRSELDDMAGLITRYRERLAQAAPAGLPDAMLPADEDEADEGMAPDRSERPQPAEAPR